MIAPNGIAASSILWDYIQLIATVSTKTETNQKSRQPKQILSNLICFTLYTMQSCNLLILFSALNISFKTSALPLHFHPHYILLRLWPYAFDNGLLPSDVPRFVFPQDSEDLLPRSDHPVKHQMFQKKGSTYTHRTWLCYWQTSWLWSQVHN